MTWNKYQENILKKWSSTSKTYSIMHSITSQYYSSWNKRLGIPAIILGAVTSSSIFTTSAENEIWTYINGCLVLLITGISGISKFLGLTEKQVKHTSAAFKYTNISMDIDTLLSFPRSDRTEDPRQFINEIKTAILEIREHSPNLPTRVVSDYINKLDKSLIDAQTKVNRTDHDTIPKPPVEHDEDIYTRTTQHEQTTIHLNTNTVVSDIYTDFTDPITEQITQISEKLRCDSNSELSDEQ